MKSLTARDVVALVIAGTAAALVLFVGPLTEKGEGFVAGERERPEQTPAPDSTFSPWLPAARPSAGSEQTTGSRQTAGSRQAADSSGGLRLSGWWKGFTSAVAADSQIVYHGDWSALEMLSVPELSFPDSSAPALKGQIPNPGPATIEDIALSGDYAYVLINDRNPNGMPPPNYFSMQVIDVSDPARPREVGYFSAIGEPHRLAVAGRHVYIANGGVYSGFHDIDDRSGLWVIDVSDPTRPREVGTFGWRFSNVVVSGERAYLIGEAAAGENPRLHILDVSDPAEPQEVGVFATRGTPTDVAVAGDYAYLAVEKRAASDPAADGHSEGRRPEGDSGGAGEGLRVLDVSGPAAPKQVAAFRTRGPIGEVAVEGSRVFVTHGSVPRGAEYLLMIDARVPSALRLEGTLLLKGHDEYEGAVPRDLAVSAGRAYVAAWRDGLLVVELPDEP